MSVISSDKELQRFTSAPGVGAPESSLRPIYDSRSYQLRRVRSLIRRPVLPVYSLEGSFEDRPMRVLVADDGSALNYFRSFVFGGEAVTRKVGVSSSALAPRLANSDADIVVVAANQLLLPMYPQDKFHFVPKWIRLYLPISGGPDEMLAEMSGPSAGAVRRNVKKMKASGFEYRLTNDPEWFDRFYYDMYRPYVQNRFGDLATVDCYEKLKEHFAEGVGLVIERGGQDVGAVILIVREKTLYFYRVGVEGGDDTYTREGASTALYYYTTLVANSWGCDGADFGHSRAFLTDGVLRYKLKWGMQVLDIDDGIGVYALATPGRTEQATRFLSANRFYELTKGRIVLCDEY